MVEGKYHPVEVNKESTRLFHQWLLDYDGKYIIKHIKVDDIYKLVPGLKVVKNIDIVHDEQGNLLAMPKNDTRNKENVVETDENEGSSTKPKANEIIKVELAKDEEGKIIVIPVKLSRIMAKYKKKQEENACKIIASVVFNTHRNNKTKFTEEEPFACGPLLAKWIAGQLNLTFDEQQQPDINRSSWVNLLKNDEIMEKTPDAINRLCKTLKDFSDKNPQCHAALCGIGGIPGTKILMRDSAYFYFAGRCEIAEVSENYDDHTPIINSINLGIITPEQSFDLRASVAKLIAVGDFLGAEASVRHVEHKQHKDWIIPIRKVANLFRGFDVNTRDIKNVDLAEVIGKINNCKKRCILPALRAESAVRSSAWTEAMHWTNTFFDNVLLDAYENQLNTWGGDYDAVILDRDVVYTKKQGITTNIKPNIPKDLFTKGKDKPMAPLTKISPIKYKLFSAKEYDDIWLSLINSNDHLIDYKTAIRGSLPSPAEYRNLMTHNRLADQQMMAAKQLYIDRKLWGNQNGSMTFLAQPLTQNVLTFLGVSEIPGWYNGLVNGLLAIMREHKF